MRRMGRLSRLVYSNKIFACIMLIVQLAILYTGFIWLRDYTFYFIGAESILTIILVIFEINRDEDPEFKLTWLMLIAIIPVFGVLLYLYLHLSVMPGDMRRRQSIVRHASSEKLVQDKSVAEELSEHDPHIAGLAGYLSKSGGSPAYKNTSVKYYPLGDYMFKDILIELEKAKSFIFLEFFIINQKGTVWPSILEILKRKAKEGVEVRLMFDGMGCMATLPRGYAEQMNEAGIQCRIFSPIQPLLSTYQNNRDHRKILVIDGRCAFCGGVNLADEYANLTERFGHWKDTGVRLTGDAAAGFTGLFLEMWNIENINENEDFGKYILSSRVFSQKADGYVIPYGDNPMDKDNVGKRVYIDIINRASKYVNIMTPYLVIDREMLEAMKFAVKRGVKVNLMLPHIPDKKYAFWLARTYYPELIRAGVRIFEYTRGFVHAKVFSSDEISAVVGTINLDYRSLYLHYECAVYLYDVPAIADIDDDYQKTIKQCHFVTMQDYKKFPLYTKFIGKLIKLVAPLF